MRFPPASLVFVQARMKPGENKPGGVGIVKHVDQKEGLYAVAYILGGVEQGVKEEFIQPHSFEEPRRRRDQSASPPLKQQQPNAGSPMTARKSKAPASVPSAGEREAKTPRSSAAAPPAAQAAAATAQPSVAFSANRHAVVLGKAPAATAVAAAAAAVDVPATTPSAASTLSRFDAFKRAFCQVMRGREKISLDEVEQCVGGEFPSAEERLAFLTRLDKANAIVRSSALRAGALTRACVCGRC
jgi:hypothetical protein